MHSLNQNWSAVAVFAIGLSVLHCAAAVPVTGATAPPKEASNIKTEVSTFRGRFFEVQYPKAFIAKTLEATSPLEADAATFTAPDGEMAFYIYSPQWSGEAPGIALDASKEVESARKSEKGKSSGVDGSYTWITIVAKDKSYTRLYQDFQAGDGIIRWVIGMRYRSEQSLKRYQAQYAAFKKSLQQFAD